MRNAWVLVALLACGGAPKAPESEPRVEGGAVKAQGPKPCSTQELAAADLAEVLAGEICKCEDSSCTQAVLSRRQPEVDQAAADLGIETEKDLPPCIRERVSAAVNRVKRCLREARPPPKCDPNDPLCGV